MGTQQEYQKRVFDTQLEALNSRAASNICAELKAILYSSNPFPKLRWPWELIQNAKDASNENVDVIFNFSKKNKSLTFSHNGKPFTMRNIICLIEGSTSKTIRDQIDDEEKPTGKYGTGFLTTHILSRKVTIKGLLVEEGFGHLNLNIELNRNEENVVEIENDIIKARETILNLFQPELKFKVQESIESSFNYTLEEAKFPIVENALEDLRAGIPYTLAFLKTLHSVKIITDDNEVEYRRSANQTITLNNNITSISIDIKHSNTIINHNHFIVATKENVAILVSVNIIDNQYHVEQLSSATPKLFCDFPLIGTNDLVLPVVIQSHDFEVTDTRNGIWLDDSIGTSKLIDCNRNLIKTAVDLYSDLLAFASDNNWRNLYNLAMISEAPKGNTWLPKQWYSDNVLKQIREKILKTPIVDTASGKRVSIKSSNNESLIYFPIHNDPAILSKMWKLFSEIFIHKIPNFNDTPEWARIIWKDCFHFELSIISQFISGKEKITNLQNDFISSNLNIVEWMNNYFEILNLDASHYHDIIANKYKVFPNQEGVFKEYSNILINDSIESELINVSDILEIGLRGKLLHEDYNFVDFEIYGVLKPNLLSPISCSQNQVIKTINSELSGNSNNKKSTAISYLISLFSKDSEFPTKRKKLYDFCKNILGDEVPEVHTITVWTDDIWEMVDKPRTVRLSCVVSKCSNLHGLQQVLNINNVNEDAIAWISKFIDYIQGEGFIQILSDSKEPIVPNQNGDFRTIDRLSGEDGTIDEDIKEIAKSFGVDIKSDLLHNKIHIPLPVNRIVGLDFYSKKIENAIYDTIRNDELKLTLQAEMINVLNWMTRTKDCELIFPRLSKERHLLLDTETIHEKFTKADKYDEIILSSGLSEEAFNQKINEGAKTGIAVVFIKTDESTANIYEEAWNLFISYCKEKGINSFKRVLELVDLDGQGRLADAGITLGLTIGTLNTIEDKRDYAIEITIRAISRITKKLDEDGYKIIGADDNAPNVIRVNHNDHEFWVVIRPSDGGKYQIRDNELEILQTPEAQLWLSNGTITTKETLGTILKRIKVGGGRFIPTGSFIPGMKI